MMQRLRFELDTQRVLREALEHVLACITQQEWRTETFAANLNELEGHSVAGEEQVIKNLKIIFTMLTNAGRDVARGHGWMASNPLNSGSPGSEHMALAALLENAIQTLQVEPEIIRLILNIYQTTAEIVQRETNTRGIGVVTKPSASSPPFAFDPASLERKAESLEPNNGPPSNPLLEQLDRWEQLVSHLEAIKPNEHWALTRELASTDDSLVALESELEALTIDRSSDLMDWEFSRGRLTVHDTDLHEVHVCSLEDVLVTVQGDLLTLELILDSADADTSLDATTSRALLKAWAVDSDARFRLDLLIQNGSSFETVEVEAIMQPSRDQHDERVTFVVVRRLKPNPLENITMAGVRQFVVQKLSEQNQKN
jgi:hypothetical protein